MRLPTFETRGDPGLLSLVRDSGGAHGIAIGRGEKDGSGDPDKIIDVQIAAIGEAAVALVALYERWADEWEERVA